MPKNRFANGAILKRGLLPLLLSLPFWIASPVPAAEAPDNYPVDIAAQADRGFRDEGGAGLRGWTGQGPDNDLSSLPTGSLNAAGVQFNVLDPAQNNGRSCLAFGRTGDALPQKPVVIPLSGQPVCTHLYLLHTAAWLPSQGAPLGSITVRYTDGSEKHFDVEAGRDVGDWWSLASLPNAAQGWMGENKSSRVGLYVSHFPIDAKPVESIRLEGSGQGVWMVVALTLSPDLVPFPTAAKETLAAGKDWGAYDYSLDIDAGSVFDFSSISDAPAGKYGHVVATPEGHFEFEKRPGVHAKFWGVNLCTQALYLDKDLADHIAERFQRSGYNVVRIHHFDRELLHPNGPSPDHPSGPSYEFDPAQLDRLEYLIYAFEQHGLYINIDLYTMRDFSAEECAAFGWPEVREKGFDHGKWFKATLPVSDAAYDSWQRFVKNLLTHPNPYTGHTLAEDPALIGICPVNEDTMANLTTLIKSEPTLSKRYDEKFAAWKADPANSGLTARDGSLFNRFLLDTEMADDARMFDYIRSLGVKAPLTGCNFIDSEAQAFLREKYDYVDDHDYWDMPRFLAGQWGLPFTTQHADPTRASAKMPRDLMPSRVFGKPFSMTESSYVWPNSHRSQGGVLLSAYAALQDWDAIYYFAYGGKVPALMTPGPSGLLDLAPDPINLLADRVAAFIFLRGDVKAAPHAVCFAVDKDIALSGEAGKWHGFPDALSYPGLSVRLGNLTGTPASILGSPIASQTGISAVVTNRKDAPAQFYRADETLLPRLKQDGILPAGADKRYTSETGQISLEADQGTAKVITDGSECFILPPGQKLDGNLVSIQNGDADSTISVVAVDGKPLSQSHRILVLHLTDSLNTGMRFNGVDHRMIETFGTLPHLVKEGTAQISLRLPDPDAWQAWAVEASGKRQVQIPLQKIDGGFMLQSNTVTDGGTRLAYEVTRP